MIIRCAIPTYQERHAIQQQVYEWHRWFAWHPVAVPHVGIVWLERVERLMHRGRLGPSWYEYRRDSGG